MLRPTVILAALVALAVVAPNATAYPYTGTSSTGNVDTWNLPQPPSCQPNPHNALQCLSQPCFPVIMDRTIRLHLTGASAMDRVSLEVVRADLYYSAPVAIASAGLDAVVEVRVSGCGAPLLVMVVTGLVVDGEVDYSITFEGSDGLRGMVPDTVCLTCDF